MTIDEAIKHAEEVATEEDKLCKRYDDASGYTRSHNEEIRTSDAIKCEKCADEHRQLAEWLKELKQLREKTRWIPVSEKLPEKTGIYLISIGDLVTSKSFDGHNFRTESAIRFIPDAWMPLPKQYKED